MGKALFFDVDGTLVNFQGKMPASARTALKKAQQNGHQIVLCSGRSKIQIYPWLLELGVDRGVCGMRRQGAAQAFYDRGRAAYNYCIAE